MRSTVFTLLVYVFCSTPLLTAQASMATEKAKINGPAEQTLAMINALKQVKKNDKSTFKDVDNYINFELLTRESIAPHRSKFTDEQAKKFSRTFESLIRLIAYPQSSSFYDEAKTSYHPPVIKGNKALVTSETTIEKEDFEMTIGYQWTKTNSTWQLSDLILDEDSLVKDYQNQFGRIIEKEGVDGLISKIEQKLLETESEVKK